MRKFIKNDYDNETEELQAQAQKIYNKWNEIQALRKKHPDETYTFYDLKVHKGVDGNDVLFNLVKRPSQGELAKKVSRVKSTTESTMAYLNLLIDGEVVAST